MPSLRASTSAAARTDAAAPQAPGGHFFDETVFAAATFLAVLLGGSWLGLALGLPVSRWHLPLAYAASAIAAVWRGRLTGRRAPAVLVALAVALLLAAAIGLADRTHDTSYDGSAYHQVGVIALRDGWNPITEPHVVDWSNAAYPERQWLADRIADRGLWTDHFPKAAWLLGATVSAATGSLDAAKWCTGFLAVVALLAFQRGLRASGAGPRLATTAAVLSALSPILLAQLNTNYVDGLLGSALLAQAGASLSWLAGRRKAHLLVSLVMVAMAANLKFTGAVYAGLLLAAVLALGWLRQWRPGEAGVVVAALLAVLGVSAQTYAHNTLAHGHPLYPVATTPVMRGQAADRFLARNRIEKFLLSATQVPGPEHDAAAPSWPLPRPWHYDRLVVQGFDLRMAGFGSLFVYSLGLSLASTVVSVVVLRRRRLLQGGAAAVLLLLAWALASSLLNPELWWMRYVPQLWWLPAMAAFLAQAAGARRLAALNLAPMALAVAMMSVFWTKDLLGSRPQVQGALAGLAQRGTIAVADTSRNSPMLYTFAQHAAERGARIELQPAADCAVLRIGFVATCGQQRAR